MVSNGLINMRNHQSMHWLMGFFAVLVIGAAGMLPAGGAWAVGIQQTEKTAGEPSEGDVKYVPNELLVKFSPSLTEKQIQDINDRLGVEVVSRMSGGRLVLVRFPYAQNFDALRDAFEATEGVEYVEPNYQYEVDPGGQGKGKVEKAPIDTRPVAPAPTSGREARKKRQEAGIAVPGVGKSGCDPGGLKTD